jgi:hypothetical protein
VSGLAAPSLSAFPSSRRRTDLSRRRPHEGISGGASPLSCRRRRRSRARRIALRLQRMAAASSSSSRYMGFASPAAMGDLIRLGREGPNRATTKGSGGSARVARAMCADCLLTLWCGGLIAAGVWRGTTWQGGGVGIGGRLPRCLTGGLLPYSAGLWFAAWACDASFRAPGLQEKGHLSLTMQTPTTLKTY